MQRECETVGGNDVYKKESSRMKYTGERERESRREQEFSEHTGRGPAARLP